MTVYALESGVAITDVRISNFRALSNIEVTLGNLTVILGANNAGKTSFLDALYAAIGAGRKILNPEDVHIAPGESFAPRTRKVTIDVRIRPVGLEGKVVDGFPEGSFWTALWGAGIAIDGGDFSEYAGIRTTMSWSIARAEYVIERKFLRTWGTFDLWLQTQTQDRPVTAAQLEPIGLHYIDAKRDLCEDIKKPGSFWRKLTDDLGLSPDDISELEEVLSQINEQIVEKSEVLRHLKTNLADLQSVFVSNSSGIDITPLARKLRDLSKGVDVSFSTEGAQPFPLSQRGMGTRSLASLMVFRAFVSWKNIHTQQTGDKVHSLLALEEPESHLHPQAQRLLFSHIKAIGGQRVVSTHSPYFAGQAQLEDLRLFIKNGADTLVTKLDLSKLTRADDLRKLQETVIESRGDLLFSRSIILCEGQTEEQALPIWAQKYWGCNVHELGFSFVRVNGTDYFPFIWLAKNLNIPWYVFADGEAQPLSNLEKALADAEEDHSNACPNIVVIPEGRNFETQLIYEGYMPYVELAMNEVKGVDNHLQHYIQANHGTAYPKNRGVRDYESEGGTLRAVKDAMSSMKTRLSKPLARIISNSAVEADRFPSCIDQLFRTISIDHHLTKAEYVAADGEI